MRASVTNYVLTFAVLLIAASTTAAQDDNWWPGTVVAEIPDCITVPDDDLFVPEDDGGAEVCDQYHPDLLERPTTQGQTEYFSWIDIDTAWVGLDATWLYVGIGIRGLKDGEIDAKPLFEIDFDTDHRGDVWVQHDGGPYPGTFGSNEKLKVFQDLDTGNDRVGGPDPFLGEGPIGFDGYEDELWAAGQDPEDGCSVRLITRASGLPRMDFACRRSVLGGPDATFAIRPAIDKGGSNDNQNFALNDKYDEAGYGSPYPGNVNNPPANIYEIDNTPYSSVELPVELGSFEVIRSNDEMVLTWTTYSETNNSGFEIQHAIGSKPFEAIAFVPGAGTTLNPKTYTHRYLTEEPGLHRFRLKQIDFDGAFSYSQAVEVAVDLPQRYVLEAAYPNPFNPSTTIRFGVAEAGKVSVRLYDALGREVRLLFEGTPAPNEMHSVSIDAKGLPSGSYVVRLEGSSYVTTRMITLLK